MRIARQLGDGVHEFAAGHPHLYGPHVLEVTADRGLRSDDPVLGQQLDQLQLTGDGVLLKDAGDAVLALRLGQSGVRVLLFTGLGPGGLVG